MLKRNTDVLLVLFGTILIALGALRVVNEAGFVFGKNPDVKTTTPPNVKIDGLTTSSERPAAESQIAPA